MRGKRFTNSVLCEDGFNLAKNCRRIKGKKRYMRPQKALATVLLKKAASKLHRYTPVLHRGAPAVRGASVPLEAWTPADKKNTKWKGLVTTKSSTSYYSPGADRDAVQYADLELGRLICQTDPPRFALLASVWVGEVCDKAHKFVLHRPGSAEWFMPFSAIPGSSVLVWPGTVGRAEGGNDDVFFFVPAPTSPTMLLVADFQEWTARSFTWRSPVYFGQGARQSGAAEPPLAVRPTMASVEKPLLTICAEHGFWALPESWLQRLSALLGVPWHSRWSDCDAVFELTTKILGEASDDVVVGGLRHRLSAMDAQMADDEDALNSLDEAVEVLEKRDEKTVAKAKESAQVRAAEVVSFREALKEKAAAVRVASAKAKAGAKRQRRAAVRKHKFPEGRVSHVDAKRLCPPDSFVWRGLNDGAWWGHMPPFKRISRSWSAYGEEEALKIVLRHLWTLHLDTHGLDRESCIWEGLFE